LAGLQWAYRGDQGDQGFIDASGRRKVKGNMDIELAVDAMELAEHIDQSCSPEMATLTGCPSGLPCICQPK
jgi:hypothetical protein